MDWVRVNIIKKLFISEKKSEETNKYKAKAKKLNTHHHVTFEKQIKSRLKNQSIFPCQI